MSGARGFDARRRLLVPELMDTERVGAAELARCHRDMERLTRWTFGHRPTLAWLARQLRAAPPGAELSLLDVGCASGETLRRIARWAARRGVRLRLRGVDLNPVALELARALTPPEWGIEYVQGDALALPDGDRPDYAVCALFLHHLSDDEAVRFLRWLASHAARAWLVSDVHRHALSYWTLRAVPPLLGMHRFVVHDGPVSIARGWRRAELEALVARAGVRARVRWRTPFRWAVEGGPA